ncbi:MAG: hypothetical protein ACYTXC_19640 [Nostoc sp.]
MSIHSRSYLWQCISTACNRRHPRRATEADFLADKFLEVSNRPLIVTNGEHVSPDAAKAGTRTSGTGDW